jgi:ribosomal protein S12
MEFRNLKAAKDSIDRMTPLEKLKAALPGVSYPVVEKMLAVSSPNCSKGARRSPSLSSMPVAGRFHPAGEAVGTGRASIKNASTMRKLCRVHLVWHNRISFKRMLKA